MEHVPGVGGADPVEIDGAAGEGGGQILRTALSLSLVTGRSFRIDRIRAGRDRPGLRAQHLASVRAAATVGRARVEGARPGSRRLTFVPRTIVAGPGSFSTGGAGSATLVLQTVLPPLMLAKGRSRVRVDGGTHNPHAPPFEFLLRAFVPILNRMGPRVALELGRRGFYPAGGGVLEATIEPRSALRPLDLLDRGALRAIRAKAILSALPHHIAERELAVVARRLELSESTVVEEPDPVGPGNVLLVEVESEGMIEVFTGFGTRGRPAERVAEGVCREVLAYLNCAAPVGPFLADQLLLPFALAGRGSFRTMSPLTAHTVTSIDVIQRFLAIRVHCHEQTDRTVRIEVRPEASAP